MRLPSGRRQVVRTPAARTPLTAPVLLGAGIGLFSVKAAAEAHGGRVEIDRSHLGGACFRVRLPLANG